MARTATRIAIGLTLLAPLLVPAGAAAYNSQAAGLLVAGKNVLLQKREEHIHKGNDVCGDPLPDQVAPDSQKAFCYQAFGIGEGGFDTELGFNYAIVTPVASGDFRGILVNDLTKKCLDLSGSHQEDGTPIQLFRCNNTGAQDFATTKSGELRVLDRCADSNGDADGNLLSIRACKGESDQRWRFDGRGRLHATDTLCVDIKGRGTDDGTRMRLATCDDSAAQQWLGSSGYAIDTHVKIGFFTDTSQLGCSIQRIDDSRPLRRFYCQTSTVHPLHGSTGPEPHWTVTAGPQPPPDAARVVFLGDSVTAGFGYCGVEIDSAGNPCGVNASFANKWSGPDSLDNCLPLHPPRTHDDRCSNNNNAGRPWEAGPWAPGDGAPTKAYPFVIAKSQRSADQATVEDWAVTGSEPGDWDPTASKTDQFPNWGRYGGLTKGIKDSWVVMTLGANPLLAEYIKVTLLAERGKCANDSVVTWFRHGGPPFGERYAAPLDAGEQDGRPGLFRCFDRQWDANQQSAHLLALYKALLAQGNHVLVEGYPVVCPWSFGDWQPEPNPFDGPAKGSDCTKLSLPTFAGKDKADVAQGGPRITQWDQAKALGARTNDRLRSLVAQAGAESGRSGDIRFALPDQTAWADHQGWSADPWIFRNDTWVHPNEQGHVQLAHVVTTAMCEAWGRWCGDPPSWR